jgi:biopolymer transport protein ExbB
MWPILAMSLLVVTFGLERLMGLRRRKVLPPELISGLGRLASQKGGLDPRQAYRLCQQFPSTAASVVKTMLLKVGRPHTELEHAVSEANEREAARLYTNVRWLSLAAGISPLLGLLGTVWGMIQAFFVTAHLPTGANKAQALADGIYVALVTTFAGLSVAIPAALLAHLFEGRIQRLLRELDETLLGLMPQLERFEGRLRVSKDQMDAPAAELAGAEQGASRREAAAAARPQQAAAAPK